MFMNTACRLCNKDKLVSLLNLGSHPIAHRFLNARADEEYTHPVNVALCDGCGLIQLVDPIPSKEMYSKYNWISAWKWNPHIPRLLELIRTLPGISPSSRVLEVGSNDGSFLSELRKCGYQNILGIEPARDAREAAAKNGIE